MRKLWVLMLITLCITLPACVGSGLRSLDEAATLGQKEMVERILAEGADVNARNKDGFTLLHVAASQGHRDVVELLLAKGADLNAKDNNGFTPLDGANAYKKSDTAKFLIWYGGKSGKDLGAQ